MSKNNHPRSAGGYLSSLKPDHFRMLYWPKYSGREIKGQGVAYGPKESVEGDLMSRSNWDIYFLTRAVELTAPQIRAFPEFDFAKPELLALQVGHSMYDRNESYSELADKVNKMFIESQLIRDTRIDEDKVLLVESSKPHSFGLFYHESDEERVPHLIYQIISFPLTEREVESLFSIAENFYDGDSERAKALDTLEKQRGKRAQMFVDRLERKWGLEGQQRMEWKNGDIVDQNGHVMGDHYGGPINTMFTGIYPIAQYTDDVVQAVLPAKRKKQSRKR